MVGVGVTALRKLLLVSPAFPPANAVDMHRVRMSLPHWRKFGWSPVVLSVEPEASGFPLDGLLTATVPSDIPVIRAGALPLALTRRAGITNLGLRAFRSMLVKGREILSREKFDLVFISTTSFLSMPLGRIWKSEFGVPFVLDLQDPWVSDDSTGDGAKRPGLKHAAMRALHRALEGWTMERVDGVVSVTPAYNYSLLRRYPRLTASRLMVSQFAATALDIEVADRAAFPGSGFDPADGFVHGVFTGALGHPKSELCRAICEAIRLGLQDAPKAFGRLRLHFIGTSYAADERATLTIEPIARELGVEHHVVEQSSRISYFHAIRLLLDAQFGIILGSDDRGYIPSKLYLYLLANKPLLCIMNCGSIATKLLRDAGVDHLVTFDRADEENLSREIARHLTLLVEQARGATWCPSTPAASYSAETMTRQLASFFDSVVQNE